VEELRARLQGLTVEEPPTCPAQRLLGKLREEDLDLSVLISDSMMNTGVTVTELHRELSRNGVKISRESITKYRNQICRCDPHCSQRLGGG
jgi:uracil phosphoribosyltransferase|tara:strand:- start:229 stop:501 length:273 start_codon:yes stop_codon:yes gene_type:complete